MPSILRNLQQEWNALVPAAQAARVPRVRLLNSTLLEPIAYRRERLTWLRAQLHQGTSLDSLSFGVEIEFILPAGQTRSSIARLITDAGVTCHAEMYGHSVGSSWKVVTDASLGSSGAEIVSPPLRGPEGFRQLQIVGQVLTAARCKVNRSCGLHVHVGVANEAPVFFKNLVKLYASSEQAIDKVVSPSRRLSNNVFCRTVRVSNAALEAATTVDHIVSAIGQSSGRANYRGAGRYCKLNLQSYYMHGTVEFRQHQGTVEAAKMENWVKLCLRMVMTARKEAKTATTVVELLDAVEATETEKTYFAQREAFFNRAEQRRAS
jgi:hypothetical protein